MTGLTHSAYKKSSFGPAFLFLNKKQREGLAVYYTFCRVMDDIADEPQVKGRLQMLAAWREEIVRVFEQKATTPLGCDLQELVASFHLPQDRFLDMIEGMEADVQGRAYATFTELEWYLWRVAGIVGLATLDILGIKGEKAHALAQTLGFAVQTTNIIRDVYEDAQMGRVYLPDDLLSAHAITREQILQGQRPETLPAALAVLAERSAAYYAQAEQLMCRLPGRKILACRVISWVYRANLAKIERTGFQFKQAIKLSKFEKLKNSVYALFNTVFAH